MERNSVVLQRLATGWKVRALNTGEVERFRSSRQALGPTQPSMIWVPRLLSVRKTHQYVAFTTHTPSKAEVKERVQQYIFSNLGLPELL